MSTNKESSKVIKFIKEYYSKFKKTPSMKDILKKCDVNPRVFYELFDSQEEAFKLAGVPYNDESRIKVEKANVARKFGKSAITVIRTYPPIKIVSRKDIINKNDEKYVDKYNVLMEKLVNVHSSYHRLYPSDDDSIMSAYEELSSFILYWTWFLSINNQQYELAKSLRYSTNPEKYFLIRLGYDFNDLEGSNKKLCEKEFNKMITEKEQMIFDKKAKEYFKKMLDEVFSSPPYFTIGS